MANQNGLSDLLHMTWPIAAACLFLSLSYLPTAIACGFRYMYPAIPLVSLLWCILLLGTTRHLAHAPADLSPTVR
jgi:hypothetical protein